MLFLTSLAERYGRQANLIYYQFKIPLNSFGRDENIKDTLLRFSYPGRLIVISAGEENNGRFFKTVRNSRVVDRKRFRVFGV